MRFVPAPPVLKEVTNDELEKKKNRVIPGWKVKQMLDAIPRGRVKLKCVEQLPIIIPHVGCPTEGSTCVVDKEDAFRLLVGGYFKLIGAGSGKSRREKLNEWAQELEENLLGDRKKIPHSQVDSMLEEIEGNFIKVRCVEPARIPNFSSVQKGIIYNNIRKDAARNFIAAGYLILLGAGKKPELTEDERLKAEVAALQQGLESVQAKLKD